jgi:hypothetical protein
MTRTGPGNVAKFACGHTSGSRPVPARPSFRELVSVWPLSYGPTVVRACVPPSGLPQTCLFSLADRSRQARPCVPIPSGPAIRVPGPPRPTCPRSFAVPYPPYLYLPEWPGTAIPGSSFDPGRDMLCILTSPPR